MKFTRKYDTFSYINETLLRDIRNMRKVEFKISVEENKSLLQNQSIINLG
jgi:hypothetical protein